MTPNLDTTAGFTATRAGKQSASTPTSSASTWTPTHAPSVLFLWCGFAFFFPINAAGAVSDPDSSPAATRFGKEDMVAVRLSQRRVDALQSRKAPYDVRDRDLKGFGVRILPSGRKRYFIHTQHEGRRIWRIVGRADEIGANEARSRARPMLAAIRSDGEEPSPAVAEIPFEVVTEKVFRRYSRNWKPSTLEVNRCYYRSTILPWFGGGSIGSIAESDVRQWFASLQNAPVTADRAAPILSVIMRQAEAYGYRPEGTNPCRGIRRYRRQGRERFLSDEEYDRLGRVLAQHEADPPTAVAIIRLLLLTGCRKGEIASPRWSDCREGNLYLPDSKTGPRTVWLSSPARRILDGLPRQSAWLFPSPRTRSQVSAAMIADAWHWMRSEAGTPDVRLHDLRHNSGIRSIRDSFLFLSQTVVKTAVSTLVEIEFPE